MKELIKLFGYEERRIFWTAVFFLVFVLAFESYTLKINYAEYFVSSFETQGFIITAITFACAVFALYLFYSFVVFALSSSRIYKIFCFLFFSVAVLIEFGYQKALGRFSNVFDIVTAIATTSDQRIVSLFLFFNSAALIPCLVFMVCLISIKGEYKRRNRQKFLPVCLLFAAFHVSVFFYSMTVLEEKFQTTALNAFCQTGTDFFIHNITNSDFVSEISGTLKIRRAVAKPELADDYRPANNIIVVVDESVRGDHLSLNGYKRSTTPFLEMLAEQKILRNWGIAVSSATSSRFSYNALVTGLMPDDFPDKSLSKVNKSPTIFQYAKAMKYKTYFFDGQMKNYWGDVADDKNYLDSWDGVEQLANDGETASWDIDNEIARRAKKLIAESTGNFIFIFKHGSHYSYSNNFPPNEAVWQPSYTIDDPFQMLETESPVEALNAYDNSIKYNIDSFFVNLVEDYSSIPNNTIIVYTSDHGEIISPGGIASHGGKSKIEATVPLFIIGNLETAVDTDYKASHHNIYPTLLDLMNYPDELRDKTYSISLLKAKVYDSKQRFYNPDLEKKVPFD